MFPNARIIEISSDINLKANPDIPERGAIIVGTEKALRHIDRVALSGVLSLDPLLLLPDFRIRERILRTLLAVQSKTEGKVFLQTRRPDEEIFSAWEQGDLARAYGSELREREHFAYPPFSILVKISWDGTEIAAREKGERVRELLTEHSPRIFPAFAQKVRNRIRLNCILKIPRESWPNDEILRRLFSLSPDFTVQVDPEDLL